MSSVPGSLGKGYTISSPHGQVAYGTGLQTPSSIPLAVSTSSSLGSSLASPVDACAASLSFLSQPRVYARFETMNDVRPDNDRFYLPLRVTNPLFDALCFNVHDSGDIIDIWVFQVTIKKVHTGVASGFAMIGELLENTRQYFPKHKINVNYVLVVPENQRWKVRWELAPAFIPGPVYIQYVDTSEQCKHVPPRT